MSGGRVEHDAGTAAAAPTIGAPVVVDNTHGGGDGNAVIDADLSPQHPTQRIPDAGVSLFDVPVVLERRYVTTSPNGDEETAGFSNAGAATGVGVSVCKEVGAPLSGESSKYVSSSNTRGDSRGDTTGGAEPSSDGEDECCERHQEAW